MWRRLPPARDQVQGVAGCSQLGAQHLAQLTAAALQVACGEGVRRWSGCAAGEWSTAHGSEPA